MLLLSLFLLREELTFEMLALEPRASDDETLESEASIGTADSSENLTLESEGAVSDRSGELRPPLGKTNWSRIPGMAIQPGCSL